MFRINVFGLVLLALPAFFVSCGLLKKQAIGLYLNSLQDKKAQQVLVEEIPASYKKQKHEILDAIWIYKEAGVSISYFSNCSQVPQSLHSFQSSSYPQNLKYKIIESHKTADFLYSVLELEDLEKQKSYIAIHSLKNKKCYFNLNFIANSKESFESEKPVFQKVIKEFNKQ